MKLAALIFGDDDRQPKTAAGKSPEPGQIVRSIDGSVYRVASKIAGPDGIVVKLANLRGKPVQTPSNFRPIGLAVARFASWMRYHLAYQKDFDLYVNSYIEQYNNQHKDNPLPYPIGQDGKAFRWANFFQKRVSPKLFVRGQGTGEDQQAVKDDIIHEMLFNTLGERHVLDQFATKAKRLGVNRQNGATKLTDFLISTFLYRVDEMQNKLNARNPEEEISMWNTVKEDDGMHEQNLLDTEEHAFHDEEFQSAEARKDVARFRESFRKWLAHSVGPKASESFILMFDIFWRLLQEDESGDIKRNELQNEWMEKTGLSFGSFKDYFTRLPEMMENFITTHGSELGEKSVFVDLMNIIRTERSERERKERRQKQKARPATVSSLKIAEGIEEDIAEAQAAAVPPMKLADGVGPDLAQAISNSENPDVVDPDIKQPTKTVPEAAKAANKIAGLVRGDQLTPDQLRQVQDAFIYRWTKENQRRGDVYHCNNCDVRNNPFQGSSAEGHQHPVIPLQSDQQWLAEHAFYFTNAGKLQPRRHAAPAFMAPEPEGLFASVAHRFAMEKTRKQAMLGHDFYDADGQAISNETNSDTGSYTHESDTTELKQRRMAAQEIWECMDCGAKGELDPVGGGCATCGSQAIAEVDVSQPTDLSPIREPNPMEVEKRMIPIREKQIAPNRPMASDKTADVGSGNTTVTMQNQNVTTPGSQNRGEPMAVPEAIDQTAGPHSPNAPMTAPRTPGIQPKIVTVPAGTEGEMENVASAKTSNEFEDLFGDLLSSYACPHCQSVNVDVTPTETGYDIYCEDCERVTPSQGGATPGVSGFPATEPEIVNEDLEMEPEEPPFEHQHEGAHDPYATYDRLKKDYDDKHEVVYPEGGGAKVVEKKEEKTADALFEEAPLADVADLDVLFNMPQERKEQWLLEHGWVKDDSWHGASWWMQKPMWSKDGYEESIPYQDTDDAMQKELELVEEEDAQAADSEAPEAEGEIPESEFEKDGAGSNSGEDDPRGVGTNYNDEFYEHRTTGPSSQGMLSAIKEAAPAVAPSVAQAPNVAQNMNINRPMPPAPGTPGATMAIMPGEDEDQGGIKRHTVEPDLPNAKYHMQGALIASEEGRLMKEAFGELLQCQECDKIDPTVEWVTFEDLGNISGTGSYEAPLCPDCASGVAQDI